MQPRRLHGKCLALLVLAMLLAGVLAACGGAAPAAAPAEEVAPAEEASSEEAAAGGEAMGDSMEAPALAAMVADGSLPPLEERLPVNPMVVEPEESIGQYGGTWHAGLRGGTDNAWIFRTIAYEPLVRWTRDWTGIKPNVAESWEANDEATEFTFKLREGMKWSDGEPFTADDITFWYEDVMMNEELTPAPNDWFMAGGEPGVVEKIDDYSVKFSFAAPYGAFLLKLASADMIGITSTPRHYMEQFHADYNPDAAAEAEEAGFENWVAHFQNINNQGCCNYYNDADLPVIWPWDLTVGYGENTTQITAERNPYYWKVDTEGNQLPYIDEVVYDVGNDVEVLVLKAMNGEIDFQDRHIGTFNNKAVFFDNMEQGGYTLTNRVNADNNVMEISLNLTHLDPVKNEIFNNKDFRIGLSHAINRQEIIDLVFVGQGEPWQAAPLPASPYYNERLATQYLEYDVDVANEHLDAAGYTERDDDGFRLGPDGNRISFLIDVPTVNTEHIDMLELIEGYWAEVGIEMKSNVIDRSLGQQRLDINEHDANACRGGPGGIGFGTLLDPRNFVPVHGHSRYALPWALYYQGVESDVVQEPPQAVLDQFEIYRAALATADQAEQTDLMLQLMETAADQFYMIGISKPAMGYAVANRNLRNIMDMMPGAWQYPTPAPSEPYQWYFEQ